MNRLIVTSAILAMGLLCWETSSAQSAAGEAITARAMPDTWRPDAGVVRPRFDFQEDFNIGTEPNGRVLLEVGGDRYPLGLRLFSAADGRWVGVGTGNQEEDERWLEANHAPDGGFSGRTASFALKRELRATPTHLEIRETVENLTTNDLALVTERLVSFEQPEDLLACRVGGYLQASTTFETRGDNKYLGGNPTLFFAGRRSGLCLFVVDDVQRVHFRATCDGAMLKVIDDRFYLRPGASYTFRWDLYPQREPSYFAAVNAIRDDWGLPLEVPGLFGFVRPDSEGFPQDAAGVKALLDDTGLSVVGTTIPALRTGRSRQPIHGTHWLADDRRALEPFRRFAAIVTSTRPGAVTLAYFDVYLSSEPAAQERYSDAVVRDSHGQPVPYKGSEALWNFYPTWENSYGKANRELVDVLLGECGYGGVYLDTWRGTHAQVSFGHDDGNSAILSNDGSYRIKQKMAYAALYCRDFQQRLVGEIVSRGKVPFANSFDMTTTAMQLPVLHTAEPEEIDELGFAHLSRAPLSLTTKGTDRDPYDDAVEFLRHGVLAVVYKKPLYGDHVLRRVYPITVRESHPGYVIGRKKIVAGCSGDYSLGRDVPLAAYVYGPPDGQFVRRITSKKFSRSGATTVRLDLEPRQIAIVEELE